MAVANDFFNFLGFGTQQNNDSIVGFDITGSSPNPTVADKKESSFWSDFQTVTTGIANVAGSIIPLLRNDIGTNKDIQQSTGNSAGSTTNTTPVRVVTVAQPKTDFMKYLPYAALGVMGILLLKGK